MPVSLQTFPSVPEANAALHNEGSRYLGGGTLAIRDVNEGKLSFSSLVRSTDQALGDLVVDGRHARIGASVTMATIAANPAFQSFAKAARSVGAPAIRNMATVGGNLFAPAPYGDFTVALLALDASVCFTSGDMTLEQFLQTRDQKREIVTGVQFAIPAAEEFRFLKVTRTKPRGSSVLTIAANIETTADGTIRKAMLALGCMAQQPIRARLAEQALFGAKLTMTGVAAAVAAICDGTEPITDPVASSWYRREVLPVHFRRLLVG